MILTLEEHTESPNFIKEKLNEYIFYKVNNVIDFKFCDKTYNRYTIFTNQDKSMEESVYYFNVELCYNEAFAHYVYESLIYFNLFKLLKKTYPTLKLLMRKPKKFKYLFCEFFNIDTADIATELSTSLQNICLFPNPISCLNNKTLDPSWTVYVKNLFDYFKQYSIKQEVYTSILMPRQTKENFWGNERTVSVEKIISNLKKDYLLLNTDILTSLADQINIVNSTSNLILTDGSPFLVNGLFVNNTNIYVIDTTTSPPNHTEYQAASYPKYKYIIDCIKDVNKNIVFYCLNEDIFCKKYISLF